MTGILTRVNRIQDVAISWEEARYRRNTDRQQQASIRRQRMTCADTVRLDTARYDTQPQNWIGGMGISASGRLQVIETPKVKKSVISKEGVRWNIAWIVIAVVAVLCAGILLGDLAGIGSKDRTINKLDRKISDLAGKNDRLQAELALRDDDISVCTEAVKLNLISANGVQTIRLSAPAEAKLTIGSR